jgi:hypothetical protein
MSDRIPSRKRLYTVPGDRRCLTDRLIRMEREILEALYQRDAEEQEAEKAEQGPGRISELVCEAVG